MAGPSGMRRCLIGLRAWQVWRPWSMQADLAVIALPVDSLIPYARNARTHSNVQVAQLAASIREFGFTNPILVDGGRGVSAGHGRLLAARKLGLTEVPT